VEDYFNFEHQISLFGSRLLNKEIFNKLSQDNRFKEILNVAFDKHMAQTVFVKMVH